MSSQNGENSEIYEFDGYRLDLAKRLVFAADGSPRPLKPKAFETLQFLVKNPGRVIERDEILAAVWPDTVVEENNLNQHISTLRRLFGDTPNSHRFIATVPGHGYKFVAEVRNPGTERANAEHAISFPLKSVWASRKLFVALATGVFASLLGLGFLYNYEKLPLASKSIRSVAVLPFKPISAGDRNRSFEMDMTHELITKLAGLDGISVRPFSAVKSFISADKDVVEAGQELGVDAVLDGSVQFSANRVRVFAKLVSVADSKELWAESFDQEPKHVFEIQEAIFERVANSLKIRPSENTKKRYTDNHDAYQAYLKGRFHVLKLAPDEVRLGIANFQQAIAIDPNYALAYAGIARGYLSYVLSAETPPGEMIELSLAAAEKAVQIDPQLAEAHATRAALYFWFTHDWVASEAAFKTALDLDPNSVFAHLGYASLLGNLGKIDEALAESKKARDLDPYSAYGTSRYGTILVHVGRPEEALAMYAEASRLDSRLWLPHCKAALALIDLHRYDDAVATARKASELNPSQTNSAAFESYALAKLGRRDEAQKILDGFLERSMKGYVPPYHVAVAYVGLGDRENALSWLEKGFAERDPKMVFLRSEPFWNEIRSEPRFIELMKKNAALINLT